MGLTDTEGDPVSEIDIPLAGRSSQCGFRSVPLFGREQAAVRLSAVNSTEPLNRYHHDRPDPARGGHEEER